MNFSSLSSNEKLGVYGSVAVIVGMLIASSGFFGFGLGILALVAAIAMLIVIFLPQMSSGTDLPGSKGTLMFACGIVAAAILVISLIQFLQFIGVYLATINGIFFLIAMVGSLAMAWAGWQELQTEGGSIRFGTGGGASTSGGASRTDAPAPSSAPGASGVQPTGSSATGSPSADTTGMGSTGAPSTSVGGTSAGSTDMGSEGGPVTRRDDDEGGLRNP